MIGQPTSIDPKTISEGNIDTTDRLFVPLKSEHYNRFDSGNKTWELRGVASQFNTNTVTIGRTVELRRGYNTNDSLWGVITDYQIFDSVNEMIETFPFEKIRPDASPEEFRESVERLLGKYDSFIAFEVTVVDA